MAFKLFILSLHFPRNNDEVSHRGTEKKSDYQRDGEWKGVRERDDDDDVNLYNQ